MGSNNAQTSSGMRRASLARFIGRASGGLQLPYASADGRQENCSVWIALTDVFPRSSKAPWAIQHEVRSRAMRIRARSVGGRHVGGRRGAAATELAVLLP